MTANNNTPEIIAANNNGSLEDSRNGRDFYGFNSGPEARAACFDLRVAGYSARTCEREGNAAMVVVFGS